jgi:hypothetical protein
LQLKRDPIGQPDDSTTARTDVDNRAAGPMVAITTDSCLSIFPAW